MNAKAYKEYVLSQPISNWPAAFLDEAALTSPALQKAHQSLVAKYNRYLAQQQKLAALSDFDSESFPGHLVIGVDEAGRGPLAGPVVAGACIIDPSLELLGLDDSKKLSEAQREGLYEVIMQNAKAYGLGIVSQEVIDDINILNATKMAMAQAVDAALAMLSDRSEDVISVAIITDHVKLEGQTLPVLPVVKGDQKSLSVAAASILAKVTRDRIMMAEANVYPGYHFEIHKGYGTPAHYAALDALGPSAIHRMSFLKNWKNPK